MSCLDVQAEKGEIRPDNGIPTKEAVLWEK